MSFTRLASALRLLARLCLLVPLIASASTFQNPQLISTSYDPNGIATGDLNHDGILDLAYIDGSGSHVLHTLLGNGNGTFRHVQDLTLPSGPCCAINLIDVNGDGVLDIVLGGSGIAIPEVGVLLGKSDGSFGDAIVSVLQQPYGGSFPFLGNPIASGDLNGDGKIDLVLPDTQNGVAWVALGDGQGNFTTLNSVSAYGSTAAYLRDLNGDGRLDLITFDEQGATVTVYLGKGDGTFQNRTEYTSNVATSRFLLADLDGDGRLDVVAQSYPNIISFLKGNSDGTFATVANVTTVGTADQLTEVADYNGDGIADLGLLSPTGFSTMLGLGGLQFGPAIRSVSGTGSIYHLSVVSGDFNSDGKRDIAMAVHGGIAILQGQGDGSFPSAGFYDLQETVGVAAVADFTGSKRRDIAVTVGGVFPRVLVNNGSGAFSLAADQNMGTSTAAPSQTLATGDFNGDGKADLDVLVPSSNFPFGGSVILLSSGNDKFMTPSVAMSGPTLIADLNNDGRADLVSISQSPLTLGQIEAMLGQSDGSFKQVLTLPPDTTFGVVALGDLNGDGKADLLTNEPGILRVWLGRGDGSFTKLGVIGDAQHLVSYYQPTAIVDLDGDGKTDVIVLPPQDPLNLDPITIYYGKGDGTFEPPVLLPVSRRNVQLVIADVNQDKRPDLVMTDGGVITVITNLGNRNFSSEDHYVAGQGIIAISASDLNGDGYPDLVAANNAGTTVTVLLNLPNENPGGGATVAGTLTVTPDPAVYQQSANATLTLSSSGVTPTGTVTFTSDDGYLVTETVVSGSATAPLDTTLLTGTHLIVANYSGDATYRSETFSTIHTILAPTYATTTKLTAAPASVIQGQTVRLTGTVSASVPVTGGLITLLDGTHSIGGFAIDSNGMVFLDTSLLATGTHSLTARYQGFQDPLFDMAIFSASTSSAVTVTVTATATTTTVSSSSSTATAGTVVTFTAKVSSASATPFGSVTFYDGSTALGTSVVRADGTSLFSTASLAAGSHNIAAAFNLNGSFAGSTSASAPITISLASPSLESAVVYLETPSPTGVLTGHVRTTQAVSGGTLTFLDNGVILGSAAVGQDGIASLSAPAPGGGMHHFTASYSGTPGVAPAVSPALMASWPDGGGAFVMTLSGYELNSPSNGNASVVIHIAPLAKAAQNVELSCASGVPAGYECAFTPSSLTGGDSLLTLRETARISSLRGLGLPLVFGLTLAAAFFGVVPRKRLALAALAGTLLLSGMWSACASLPHANAQGQSVVTVQAIAGLGDSQTIQSAQVLVEFGGDR